MVHKKGNTHGKSVSTEGLCATVAYLLKTLLQNGGQKNAECVEASHAMQLGQYKTVSYTINT